MKLASLKRGRDGALVVVSNDLAWCADAGHIAPTLQAALDDVAPFSSTLRVCAGIGGALRSQLRVLLNYHCGVTTLRTRQMIRDLQGL